MIGDKGGAMMVGGKRCKRSKDRRMKVAERPKLGTLGERHCLAVYGKVWVESRIGKLKC